MTREDDIQHGFYHAVSAQHVEAALDENGKLTLIFTEPRFHLLPLRSKRARTPPLALS